MDLLGAGQYLNYDIAEDRAVIVNGQWNARAPLLVFDEIHRIRGWKNWLKGVVDAKPAKQHILVTGSAHLDTFRQSGDSLAGRFLAFGCTLFRCANGVIKLAQTPKMRSRIYWRAETSRALSGAGPHRCCALAAAMF